jgi:hypothetical protein
MASAAAAVAAAAVRDQQRIVADRTRSQRENARNKADVARREMSAGPLDFAKAVKALRAKRAAELAEAKKRRPTLLALSDGGCPEEVVGPSGKVYSSTSICCMRPYHHPRKLGIWICENRFFDPLILLTIMCNCLTMAWESPLDPCCTPKADFIDVRSLLSSPHLSSPQLPLPLPPSPSLFLPLSPSLSLTLPALRAPRVLPAALSLVPASH